MINNELEINQNTSHKSEEEIMDFAQQNMEKDSTCDYMNFSNTLDMKLTSSNHYMYGFINNIIDKNRNTIIDENSQKYKDWIQMAPNRDESSNDESSNDESFNSNYNIQYNPYDIDDKIYTCQIPILFEDYQRFVQNNGDPKNIQIGVETLKQNMQNGIKYLKRIIDTIKIKNEKQITSEKCKELYTYKITNTIENLEIKNLKTKYTIKKYTYTFKAKTLDTIKNTNQSRNELLYMMLQYMIDVIQDNINDINNVYNNKEINNPSKDKIKEISNPIQSRNTVKKTKGLINKTTVTATAIISIILLLLAANTTKNKDIIEESNEDPQSIIIY